MGNFDRGNRSGGGGGERGFGRRDFGGSSEGGRPQMHKAICSSCGRECELPFKPTGERPVYCRDCFAKNGGGEKRSFGRDDRNSAPRPSFNKSNEENRASSASNETLNAINSKLDRILRLLEPQKEEVAEVVVKKKKAAKKVSKTAGAPTIIPEVPAGESSIEPLIQPETPAEAKPTLPEIPAE